MDKRIKTIAEHYGFENQTEKAIEEMSELIVAIKHMKKPDPERGAFIDFLNELTDVEIMVNQLKVLAINENAETEGFLERNYDFKLSREMMRMEAEK